MDSNMIFFKKRAVWVLFACLVGMQSMHINAAEIAVPSFASRVIESVNSMKSAGVSSFIAQTWKKYRFPVGVGLFVLVLLYNGYVQAVKNKAQELKKERGLFDIYSRSQYQNKPCSQAFSDIGTILYNLITEKNKVTLLEKAAYKELLKWSEAFIEKVEDPKNLPILTITPPVLEEYKEHRSAVSLARFALGRQGLDDKRKTPESDVVRKNAIDYWFGYSDYIASDVPQLLEYFKTYERISPTFHGDPGLKGAINLLEDITKNK